MSASRLLADIESHCRETGDLTGVSKLSSAVRGAMLTVAREDFIEQEQRPYACYDSPLPIGYGQTISQPFLVALMTELLKPQAQHRILEIGTGSGYQAAILSQLVEQVVSIEIVKPLAERARQRLSQLGYDRVTVVCGDGYHGCPEHGPYHGIIITAATAEVPEPLFEQLSPGGRIVAPIGHPGFAQQLMVFEADCDGHIEPVRILPVSFVPFTRA